MIDRSDAERVSKILDAHRHDRYHVGYYDFKSDNFYIMHSERCLDMQERGLRTMYGCSYSQAADEGQYADFPQDTVLYLAMDHGTMKLREGISTENFEIWTDGSMRIKNLTKTIRITKEDIAFLEELADDLQLNLPEYADRLRKIIVNKEYRD